MPAAVVEMAEKDKAACKALAKKIMGGEMTVEEMNDELDINMPMDNMGEEDKDLEGAVVEPAKKSDEEEDWEDDEEEVSVEKVAEEETKEDEEEIEF